VQDTVKGYTALTFATTGGFSDCIKVLAAATAKSNAKLIRATESGTVENIKAAISTGGDVDARDGNGRTPLMIAVIAGHADCVGALVAAGSDVTLTDSVGRTALTLARRSDVVAILKRRLKTEDDAWQRADRDGTPDAYLAFHKAFPHSHKLVVMYGPISWGHGMHNQSGYDGSKYSYVLDGVSIDGFSASVSLEEGAILGIVQLRQKDDGSTSIVMDGVTPPTHAIVLLKDDKVVACQPIYQ